jgi:hypothetical protein
LPYHLLQLVLRLLEQQLALAPLQELVQQRLQEQQL